jgi:hypothetical protein
MNFILKGEALRKEYVQKRKMPSLSHDSLRVERPAETVTELKSF